MLSPNRDMEKDWPDLDEKLSLKARHTLVITEELKEKLRRLRNHYRKDINKRLRKIIEAEVDQALAHLEGKAG